MPKALPASRGLAKRFAVLCDIDREWGALAEIPPATADDPLPIAFRLILEAHVVRKFLAEPGILKKRAVQTPEFRKSFADFTLDGTEGYLLSLVAGGLTLDKILLASTLGRFRTLFSLAQLRQKGVLVFEDKKEDPDMTWSRRHPSR